MAARPRRRPRSPRGDRALFRHVMVPVDLSDRNERALQTALALARDRGARVTLLHVVQRVPGISTGELEGFYRRLVDSSDRTLGRAARRFAAQGIRVGTVVRVGEPAHEIVATAAREGADLVVMGSHQVRPGRRAQGWGTTSYRVGIFCQCPILLVK